MDGDVVGERAVGDAIPRRQGHRHGVGVINLPFALLFPDAERVGKARASALIASSFNMKGTAQTVQTATMTSTEADLILATGDRVGIDFSAGGTELAGVTVTIYLYPL